MYSHCLKKLNKRRPFKIKLLNITSITYTEQEYHIDLTNLWYWKRKWKALVKVTKPSLLSRSVSQPMAVESYGNQKSIGSTWFSTEPVILTTMAINQLQLFHGTNHPIAIYYNFIITLISFPEGDISRTEVSRWSYQVSHRTAELIRLYMTILTPEFMQACLFLDKHAELSNTEHYTSSLHEFYNINKQHCYLLKPS